MALKITVRKNGKVVSQRVLTDEERRELEERYKKSHPVEHRGSVAGCCDPPPKSDW